MARRRLRISPRARRLANQLRIDWSNLTGSGKTGRIREADIRAAINSSAISSDALRVRRVIAERMLHSVNTTAPVTLHRRVDATQLVTLRQHFKSAQQDIVPSYQDILALLVARALQTHPEMQYQWPAGQMIAPQGIHIGLAVETPTGLLVPVIRNCDQLSLPDLARRSFDLVQRARAGKSTAEELNGGTFTITNLGAFGIEAFTPIINSPEAAILGLGAIRREAAVVDDNRIVAQQQMTLSLTFDHRVIDGAPAARFLQTLSHSIETVDLSFVEA